MARSVSVPDESNTLLSAGKMALSWPLGIVHCTLKDENIFGCSLSHIFTKLVR